MNIILVPPCGLGIRLQICFDVDGCDFLRISHKTEATLIPNIDLMQILNALLCFFPPLAFVHLYHVCKDTGNLWP